MRKNQRTLMLFISVLTIVSFIWLYNRTDVDKLAKASVATVYGQAVGGPEVERMARQLRIVYSLGLEDLLRNLSGRSQRGGEEEYVWNTMVLRHVAADLQVVPSDDAVEKRIETLPAFQTNGQFDYTKYNTFLTDTLTPQGYSKAQLEELIRDDLRLARLRELIGSAVAVAPSEVRDAFAEGYSKRHLSFVRLNREEIAKNLTVTPDEIKTYFQKNQASFKTDEKRVVQYVVFQLADKDKTLKDKELVAALQPLSNKAEDFSQKMLQQGAQFTDVAAKLETPVLKTASFTQDSPPTEIASVTNFAATAFGLTQDNPDSDVLQTDTAFYILHLDKIEPAQPQTLEQATPKIASLLQEEKVRKALTERAAALKKQLSDALKSGKTFTQAVEAAGLKAETIPPFSLAEPGDDMTNRSIMDQSGNLQPGALSDLVETPEGGSIVFLEKIDPLEDSLWDSHKADVLDHYLSGKRDLNFAEWLRVQRQLADVRLARG